MAKIDPISRSELLTFTPATRERIQHRELRPSKRGLTDEELLDILYQVRYKPGSQFFFLYNGMGQAYIGLKVTVPDVKTGEMRQVHWIEMPFLAERTEPEVLDRCWNAVRHCEEHEAGEWFQYLGKRPHNPHTARGWLEG